MKIRKLKLSLVASIFGMFMSAGGSVLAAPPAPVVSPTTVNSGDSVNVQLFCTAAGNTIDSLKYSAISNGVSDGTFDVSSFTQHACTASDVTNGFTVPVQMTGSGQATFGYIESGSGGSPGSSAQSNILTISPSSNQNTGNATIMATGSTIALDGSSPITNNMWLKHVYTIKSTGTVGYNDKVYIPSGHWFSKTDSTGQGPAMIDSAGADCTAVDFGYECTGLSIPSGQSVQLSFKTFFQVCNSENQAGSTYSQDVGPPIVYGATADEQPHKFEYKYLGCDYSAANTSTSNSDNSSSIGVPSTGFSSLSTSLMIILSGLGLAGASVFAVNKFRR
jgi:hypothetical protein